MRVRVTVLHVLGVLAAAGVFAVGLSTHPAYAVDNGIRFSSRALPTSESAGRATIELKRAATAALEVSSVDYRTEDLDAAATDDYESVRGRVTMGVGQATATISVFVFDDFQTEGEERFAIVLADIDDPDRVLDRVIVSVTDNDGVRAKWGVDDEVGDVSATSATSAKDAAAAAAAAEAARRRSTASVPARSTSRPVTARPSGASVRSGRVTPFQLQPPAGAADGSGDVGPAGVLAVVAGAGIALVLARVWFRWRLTAVR